MDSTEGLIDRRAFLGTLGSAAGIGLAGCTDNGEETDLEPTPTDTETPTDTTTPTETPTQTPPEDSETDTPTQTPTETDNETTSEPDNDTTTEKDTETETEPEPEYTLQASNLQYDLTDLPTSELDQHDRAYVEENYAETPVSLLEDGEEVGLEQLGDLVLENQDGQQVELVGKKIPEYAVEDGEELTVNAAVNDIGCLPEPRSSRQLILTRSGPPSGAS